MKARIRSSINITAAERHKFVDLVEQHQSDTSISYRANIVANTAGQPHLSVPFFIFGQRNVHLDIAPDLEISVRIGLSVGIERRESRNDKQNHERKGRTMNSTECDIIENNRPHHPSGACHILLLNQQAETRPVGSVFFSPRAIMENHGNTLATARVSATRYHGNHGKPWKHPRYRSGLCLV